MSPQIQPCLFVEPAEGVPGLVNAYDPYIGETLSDLTMAQAKDVARKRGLDITPVASLAEIESQGGTA